MAQVFGEPGRSATAEVYKRFRRFGLVALLTIAALAVLEGYSLSAFVPIKGLPSGWIVVIDTLLLLVIVLIGRWGTKKMDEFDRARRRCQSVHMSKKQSSSAPDSGDFDAM